MTVDLGSAGNFPGVAWRGLGVAGGSCGLGLTGLFWPRQQLCCDALAWREPRGHGEGFFKCQTPSLVSRGIRKAMFLKTFIRKYKT